jgi:shikimate kinase
MIRFGFGRKRKEQNEAQATEGLRATLGARSLVMIGLMGCGKSAVGRRLAGRLNLPFVDADEEIEKAAQKSITEIFADHGEAYFRDRERMVIARLLGNGPQVLATGGGAFMNAETRANVRNAGFSIWLKADLPVLMKRVAKRETRPLLKSGDPEATMRRLMAERYPVYAEADITVESRDVAHEVIVNDVLAALRKFLPLAQKQSV